MTPTKLRDSATYAVRNAWLGLRIRDLRLEAGVSAADLGAGVGLHEQTVYAYEQGRISPPWDKVLDICQMLGVDSGPLSEQYTRRFFGRRRSLAAVVAPSPVKS